MTYSNDSAAVKAAQEVQKNQREMWTRKETKQQQQQPPKDQEVLVDAEDFFDALQADSGFGNVESMDVSVNGKGV